MPVKSRQIRRRNSSSEEPGWRDPQFSQFGEDVPVNEVVAAA